MPDHHHNTNGAQLGNNGQAGDLSQHGLLETIADRDVKVFARISLRDFRMFQRTRHFAPALRVWDEADAREAIAGIVADAMSNGDATTLWPAHPMDDGVRDGQGCLYFGAVGTIWALDYLRRVQAVSDVCDLAPFSVTALERNAAWSATTAYRNHAYG